MKWNSLLKSKEHQLECVCNPWRETWAEESQSGSMLTQRRAKVCASRVGLGRIRYLDTRLLWKQHNVGRRNFHIHKVAGSENKADIGMKDVYGETLTKRMQAMQFEEATGRHPRSLKVAHNQGLGPRTEITNGNENMIEDEDSEINQVGRG